MPNQAKDAKQTEVELLTKMTLPNQAKLNEAKLKSWKKIDVHGKQRWQKAHLKSTRKANILNLGQPLKTEGRAL